VDEIVSPQYACPNNALVTKYRRDSESLKPVLQAALIVALSLDNLYN
jgi:hypothetical protein